MFSYLFAVHVFVLTVSELSALNQARIIWAQKQIGTELNELILTKDQS